MVAPERRKKHVWLESRKLPVQVLILSYILFGTHVEVRSFLTEFITLDVSYFTAMCNPNTVQEHTHRLKHVFVAIRKWGAGSSDYYILGQTAGYIRPLIYPRYQPTYITWRCAMRTATIRCCTSFWWLIAILTTLCRRIICSVLNYIVQLLFFFYCLLCLLYNNLYYLFSALCLYFINTS